MEIRGKVAGNPGSSVPVVKALPSWFVNACVELARLGPAGRSTVAPGTVATVLWGIPAACLIALMSDPWPGVVLTVFFFISCYVSDVAEVALNKSDPREVVIDELIGFLITMAGLPLSFKSLVLGVILFRLFDIWKPWPVRLLDRDEGGFWIIMDDVGAGCYAHAVLWLILVAWP